MIDKLKWDSNFFGYPVGKFLVNDGYFFNQDLFIEKAKPFKLVYIMAKSPINIRGECIRHVDNKIIFTKEIDLNKKSDPLDGCVLFQETQLDYNELLKLTFESGKYSRFKLDLNFKKNEFKRLYKEWIAKSLREAEKTKVLVYPDKSYIAGFITISINRGFSEIGLVAVSPGYQGQGLGSKLLSSAEKIAREHLASMVKVATQEMNENAIKLYLKNGYNKSEKIYIYHYWNNP